MLKFKKHKIPDYPYKKAIKKAIPIKCYQINEPFEVETMEGTLRGKTGDWLMIGVNGEMYPCDHNIFKKTYNLLK
jgi:hypothetical protein